MALTFVPTPLGNLGDITLRALTVLRECSLVLAEDTRVARRLLSAHHILGKTIWTYNEHTPERSIAAVLDRAASELIAVTTDAGTPGISDPGRELVRAARAAGVGVDVLPGPCAFVPAAVLSGFDLTAGLRFAGFVPRTLNAKRTALAAALAANETTAYYEAPHRIRSTLKLLAEIAPAHPCFVVRELSKQFEEHLSGTADEIADRLAEPPRGEFVLVLGPCGVDATASAVLLDRVRDEVDALLDEGISVSEAARRVASAHSLGRSACYEIALARREASAARE